jgi:hypothetical protein
MTLMSSPSTASLPPPDVLVTTPGGRVSVPSWVRQHAPTTLAGDRLGRLRRLPAITVVEAAGPIAVLRQTSFLKTLAGRHAQTPGGAKVLFYFHGSKAPTRTADLADLLQFFDRYDDVEFARGAEQGSFAFQEAVAKLARGQGAPASAPGDPFGEVGMVLAATRDLRAPSGRLSARRVAAAFGLPVAELARLLGRSRQAVAKTDDAESMQAALATWARIARLRAVLAAADFRAWLSTPNELLAGGSPLDVVRAGEVAAVADLAEDMLSGSSS